MGRKLSSGKLGWQGGGFSLLYVRKMVGLGAARKRDSALDLSHTCFGFWVHVKATYMWKILRACVSGRGDECEYNSHASAKIRVPYTHCIN